MSQGWPRDAKLLALESEGSATCSCPLWLRLGLNLKGGEPETPHHLGLLWLHVGMGLGLPWGVRPEWLFSQREVQPSARGWCGFHDHPRETRALSPSPPSPEQVTQLPREVEVAHSLVHSRAIRAPARLESACGSLAGSLSHLHSFCQGRGRCHSLDTEVCLQ